jgi:aryl-alcohol dehydrogenase-like predicted oxidoreductase
MEYRKLGGSGIRVSAIGLGMAALGRPGYINLGHGVDLDGKTSPAELAEHAGKLLDAARAAGVTYLDAARSYGRAEEFLAHWLDARGIEPSEVVVGSKWGYIYAADWAIDADVHEVKVHTRDNLDSQYDESASLLGTYLRLYQIHSATLESGVLGSHEVVSRLADLRDSGLVVGFSTSGPHQAETIRRALDVEAGGSPVFGAVQATWNLLEPSADSALEEAADAGLGVIVKEAVANGRLSPRSTVLAGHIAQSAPEWSLDSIAIAACLHQPWASVVLSGAATVKHLESNLAALSIPTEVLDLIPDLSEEPGDYWGTRGDLAWG